MSDIDLKIQDKKLQLGSLNDELRDTVKLVEAKHIEKQLLEKTIEDLISKSGSSKAILLEIQAGHARELNIYLRSLKEIENKIQLKHKEMNQVIDFMFKLESQKEVLAGRISELEARQKELTTTVAGLEQNNKKANELREEIKLSVEILGETNKEINLVSSELKEIKEELAKTSKNLKEKKEKHEEWINRTKEKTESNLKSAKIIEGDWRKKYKDLRVAEARLRKYYKGMGLPFPQIYNTST